VVKAKIKEKIKENARKSWGKTTIEIKYMPFHQFKKECTLSLFASET